MTEREKLESKHSENLTRMANGASYIRYTEDGKPCVILFRPKSKKPWRRTRFENDLQRRDVVNQFVSQMNDEFSDKRKRRDDRKSAVKAFRESVEVGDLFAYSWGGLRRHVWFYVLVEKKADSARLMRIGSKESLGYDGGTHVVPDMSVSYTEGMLTKKYGPGCFEMPDGSIEKTTESTKFFISK